ncbi:unnamed protein product [Thelazia callipaeda]|uniref:PDZ domain-containing protein n=1 Tax=Thelazia callipaeda TaxID=103827 RepID=A0A0N5CSV0_THECL|nr:unnamed protein product [Thelazia callipaeda]
MHRHSIASELRRGSTDCCYMQQNHTPFKDGKEPILDANLMRSVDNLYLSKPNHSSHHNGMRFTAGRRLPNLPINNAILDGNSRRMHKLVTENRSQSVGRVPRLSDSSLTNSSLDLSYRPSSFQVQSPVVRAQLIALDHRGLRTVLIEKLQPGPFGFYIATGVYNQKRGIYISRVSLPSLTPILSVGDEIIYVENELVKGEDLEYVQALIAGKNCVKIVVLPTVATPSC